MADQMEDKFNKIKEGKAHVYFNKVKNQVFYNPIQEFNRDLSIAVLNTYSKTNDNKKLRILEALAASGMTKKEKIKLFEFEKL
jgi:tRNA (guanine26-N2/guanine27-N2)-dimethyltransferase